MSMPEFTLPLTGLDVSGLTIELNRQIHDLAKCKASGGTTAKLIFETPAGRTFEYKATISQKNKKEIAITTFHVRADPKATRFMKSLEALCNSTPTSEPKLEKKSWVANIFSSNKKTSSTGKSEVSASKEPSKKQAEKTQNKLKAQVRKIAIGQQVKEDVEELLPPKLQKGNRFEPSELQAEEHSPQSSSDLTLTPSGLNPFDDPSTASVATFQDSVSELNPSTNEQNLERPRVSKHHDKEVAHSPSGEIISTSNPFGDGDDSEGEVKEKSLNPFGDDSDSESKVEDKPEIGHNPFDSDNESGIVTTALASLQISDKTPNSLDTGLANEKNSSKKPDQQLEIPPPKPPRKNKRFIPT
ncbi:MAG: hypothetical protein HAW66_03770 [Shewanella sp.]|nr:hypothetical protein [Shewanella sp.]